MHGGAGFLSTYMHTHTAHTRARVRNFFDSTACLFVLSHSCSQSSHMCARASQLSKELNVAFDDIIVEGAKSVIEDMEAVAAYLRSAIYPTTA